MLFSEMEGRILATTFEERLTGLEKENTEIKRRLSTAEGQFEYISGRLCDPIEQIV